jgi:hypothetical protein
LKLERLAVALPNSRARLWSEKNQGAIKETNICEIIISTITLGHIDVGCATKSILKKVKATKTTKLQISAITTLPAK